VTTMPMGRSFRLVARAIHEEEVPDLWRGAMIRVIDLDQRALSLCRLR